MSELKNTPQSLLTKLSQLIRLMNALMAEYDRNPTPGIFRCPPRGSPLYARGLYLICFYEFVGLAEQIRRASFVGLIVLMAFTLYPLKTAATGKHPGMTCSWGCWCGLLFLLCCPLLPAVKASGLPL